MGVRRSLRPIRLRRRVNSSRRRSRSTGRRRRCRRPSRTERRGRGERSRSADPLSSSRQVGLAPETPLKSREASTYGALLRVPGFARIYASLLLGRTAGQMSIIALILFVLERYHSPQLAGATAFVMSFPGLVTSPLAGALLDRYGRVPLVVVDFLIAGVSLGLIAVLSAAHSLPAPVLLLVAGVGSLTGLLSAAGSRSLFPILVPSRMWERANALDSGGHVVSSLIGAPLAGALVGFAGGEWALAAAGAMFAAAGLAMVGVRDPSGRKSSGHVPGYVWL